jgi:hypothetical protein
MQALAVVVTQSASSPILLAVRAPAPPDASASAALPVRTADSTAPAVVPVAGMPASHGETPDSAELRAPTAVRTSPANLSSGEATGTARKDSPSTSGGLTIDPVGASVTKTTSATTSVAPTGQADRTIVYNVTNSVGTWNVGGQAARSISGFLARIGGGGEDSALVVVSEGPGLTGSATGQAGVFSDGPGLAGHAQGRDGAVLIGGSGSDMQIGGHGRGLMVSGFGSGHARTEASEASADVTSWIGAEQNLAIATDASFAVGSEAHGDGLGGADGFFGLSAQLGAVLASVAVWNCAAAPGEEEEDGDRNRL